MGASLQRFSLEGFKAAARGVPCALLALLSHGRGRVSGGLAVIECTFCLDKNDFGALFLNLKLCLRVAGRAFGIKVCNR